MDRKLEKIKGIDDEVGVFQPLLQAIFARMNAISSVVCKQGSQEFGTDFILSKNDEILGTTGYIGVIVKTQKIKQDSHDVVRQIDECITMPRTMDGNKVHVKEIWVVTSKTISANAQEFFYERFKSAKIELVDAQKVVRWIDSCYEEYWSDVPVSIGNYLTVVREDVSALESSKSLSLFPGEDSGIRQDLIKIESDDYNQKRRIKKRRKTSSVRKLLDKAGVYLVEGEMGSGKSFLIRAACKEVASGDFYLEKKLVPFYVEMKDFQNVYSGSLELMVKKYFPDGFDEEQSPVFFIDSFDEVKLSSEERAEKILEIMKQRDVFDGSRIIIASRNLDEKVLASRGLENVSRFRVSPIPVKQIIDLVARVCSSANVKNRLAEDIGKSNLFKVIPRTPISAFLLTRLIQENRTELPSNLTELYSKYMELSLGRWDWEKGLQSEKEYEAARKIVIEISAYFMDNNLPCISYDEMLGFFKSYLGQRNLGIDPEDLFSKVLHRSDIIIKDDRYDTCRFKHRSFVEFFYAQGRSSAYQEVVQEDFDLYWVTATYFWTGLLRDCPDHIRQLVSCNVDSEQGRLLKLINMGDMLLSAHQTPYVSISGAVKDIFLEAGIYFDDIRSGRVETKLAGMSEMHLLCVFRHIMAQGFGYEFFEKALENALLEIAADELVDVSSKSYSLFMLCAAAMPFKGTDPFSYLVEDIGIDNMPYSVKLGIQHEAQLYSLSGKSVKRVMKSINKAVKSREVRAEFGLLYNRPLNQLSVR